MSLSWNERYQAPPPGRTLRYMTRDDLPGAVALTGRVGWSYDLADWTRLFDLATDGCFVIEEEGRGIIGTTTTISYGSALAWIGMVIVDPERQRQGCGRQLVRAALDHLIARATERIMLDSSPAGRPLYEQMGFRRLHHIEHWEGRASTFLGPRAARLRLDDLPALLEFDAAMFGIDRSRVLAQQVEHFPEIAWVSWSREGLQGYLLGRARATGVVLGPWLATSPAAAEELLRAALEQLQGKQVIMNLPDDNARAIVLAHSHNLSRSRTATRMIYRDAQPIRREPLIEYAIGSLATG